MAQHFGHDLIRPDVLHFGANRAHQPVMQNVGGNEFNVRRHHVIPAAEKGSPARHRQQVLVGAWRGPVLHHFLDDRQ